MKWELRVVRKSSKTEIRFGVHEVYYDDHGNPQFCSTSAIEVEGYHMKSIRQLTNAIQRALALPVLDYHKDFSSQTK